MSKIIQKYSGRVLRILPFLLIGLGLILRLAVYLQNRNLIIDESNVARNIYERDFSGLLLPLSYEQYAPPLFLWILKLSSVFFGFSEYSLRLYALTTGMASLGLMYLLLKELVPMRSLWYALFLFATAHILLRYSSELKQYMGDVMFILALPLLALRVKLQEVKQSRFILIWIAAGTIAIWTSMPSVFALAGVGLYYFLGCIKRGDYKRIWLIALPGALWAAQFLFYYFVILKDQADSSYLQNFHRDNFLFATPADLHELVQNWAVFSALLRQFGNNEPVDGNVLFNVILLLAGTIYLLIRNLERAALLLTPVIAVLMAAALNKFSLLPRVALFVIPLILLLITIGLEWFYKLRLKYWPAILTVLALVYAFDGNSISMLWKPFKAEQITEGLAVMKQHKINGPDILLYHSSGPAFTYYTQIHPRKEQWAFAKGADVLKWDTKYDSLANEMKNLWNMDRPFGLIFTNATEQQARERVDAISIFFRKSVYIQKDYVKAYIFY